MHEWKRNPAGSGCTTVFTCLAAGSPHYVSLLIPPIWWWGWYHIPYVRHGPSDTRRHNKVTVHFPFHYRMGPFRAGGGFKRPETPSVCEFKQNFKTVMTQKHMKGTDLKALFFSPYNTSCGISHVVLVGGKRLKPHKVPACVSRVDTCLSRASQCDLSTRIGRWRSTVVKAFACHTEDRGLSPYLCTMCTCCCWDMHRCKRY